MPETLSEEEFSELAEEELDESTIAKLKRGAEKAGEKFKIAASKAKEGAEVAATKAKEGAEVAGEKISDVASVTKKGAGVLREKIKEQNLREKFEKAKAIARVVAEKAKEADKKIYAFTQKRRTVPVRKKTIRKIKYKTPRSTNANTLMFDLGGPGLGSRKPTRMRLDKAPRMDLMMGMGSSKKTGRRPRIDRMPKMNLMAPLKTRGKKSKYWF